MEVIVIGGGPAGMISAIEAARANKKVTIIEANSKPCRKIYSTGNGRCNYTNVDLDNSFYNENARELVERSLAKFNNNDLKNYLEDLSIFTRDINGYLYPNSEQAASVAEALVNELNRLKVNILLDEKVVNIEAQKTSYKVKTDKDTYSCDKLIIAVGGLAAPSLGSDGNLFDVIKSLGHRFTKLKPALVGLTTKDKRLNSLQGVRTRAKVTLYQDNIKIASDTGEIIFNKNYIGGIPVMQLSSSFNSNANNSLVIDLLEDYNEEELKKQLFKRLKVDKDDKRTIYQALTGVLNGKLLEQVIISANIKPDLWANKLEDSQIINLVNGFKSFKIEVNDTLGFDKAQVTSGGIRLEEINDNMMSKIHSGLYFAGEILDVDGKCGGYNLQWAFTSGYIAGQLK